MNLYEHINKVKVTILAILIVFVMCSTSWAANPYWVDNNGTASWENCQSASPLSGASACSLSTANSNASAGDTINMRAGTYGTAIVPSNSGSSNSNRITYQNYNDELVTISGLNEPLQIGSHDYIKITGSANQNIIISSCKNITDYMSGADYNIFAYITAGPQSSYGNWGAFSIGNGSDYNWVHHCTFHDYGDLTEGDDRGEIIQIGGGSSSDQALGNVVEDCTIYHGAHALIAIHGKYTVVRNNYLHNEIWQDGWGGRCIIIKDKNSSCTHGWNLVDGNRIAFATLAPDSARNYNIQVDGHDNILRRNLIYASVSSGIRQYPEYDNCNDNTYIYNNNFFYNGLGGNSSYRRALFLARWDSATMTGIVVKNNIFKDNDSQGGTDFLAHSGVGYTMTNNYMGSDGDHLFTDETIPEDETDNSVPDFTLQENSPCIDGGSYLTQTNGSGSNSTTFIVDDAHYFFSGDGSPWDIPSYTGIKGDYIFVDNSSSADFIVEIASINYGTNTLTLASSQTWDDNAKVYLAVSDTIGFYGNAPDMGAYESGGGLMSAPKSLTIKDPS